jgi:putative transposase
VDTLGNLLRVRVHPADESENTGGVRLLAGLATMFGRLALVWVDQGYKATFVAWVQTHLGWRVEVVQKPVGQREFTVQPKRWLVERSIAWLTRPRRLSKDYEYWEANSEAYVYLASIHLLLRRLASAT